MHDMLRQPRVSNLPFLPRSYRGIVPAFHIYIWLNREEFMAHLRAKALIFSAVVATTGLTAAPSVQAAGTPAVQCQQAIAKSLSKGVKKALG